MRDSLEQNRSESRAALNACTCVDARLKEVRICVGVCINVAPRGGRALGSDQPFFFSCLLLLCLHIEAVVRRR